MSTFPKSLLKDLPLKLQNASVKNRVELLTNLTNNFVNPEEEDEKVPADLAAKSLAKILTLVLPRYSDAKSRAATLKLIQVLLEKHLENVSKVFASSLSEYFSSWAQIIPSLYLVKIALFGLQWTSMIIQAALQKE